jgi:hypothetical protein
MCSLRQFVHAAADEIAAAVGEGESLAAVARRMGHAPRYHSFRSYFYEAQRLRQAAASGNARRRTHEQEAVMAA